jgi:hypothetical protein
VDNTSLSSAASNIIVACDFRGPRPAVPRIIRNDLCERIRGLVGQRTTSPPSSFASYARPVQPKRSQNQRLGFQIEIKESKTPGAEHCLDPPGAELQLGTKLPSKLAILVAVPRHNDLVNYHVIAVFDVVNANLRIFSDFRSFDNPSI